MKIEFEIDDTYVPAIKSIFGESTDMSIILKEMLQQLIVMATSYPEEFTKAFEENSLEDRKIFDEQMQILVPKILRKAGGQ